MTDHFKKTGTILDEILTHKVTELQATKKRVPFATVEQMSGRVSKPLDFIGALHMDTVALIAEVKKASPSKGVLIENFDHIALGKTYAENGAAAISVLTDERFFQGHLLYLKEVKRETQIPVLRKEFIIDPYQIYEARMARADAILLIVAALTDPQLLELYQCASSLGMASLVEVHDESELERALKIGAELVGINNRNLKTFEVDLATTERLARLVPENVTLVAESGLKSPEDVARMGNMGAHAVLIGEGLVTAPEVAHAVQLFSEQKRN